MDAQIRLIRQELLAVRQTVARMLDALDQRLSSLESEEPASFQRPKNYRTALRDDLRRARRRNGAAAHH